ncbi:hypothetical protein N8468_04720 [Planktomarina temperata]|nr:hypothetical protein [Planktomarina temperata]
MADIKLIVDSSDLVTANKRVGQLDESVGKVGATTSTAGKGINSVNRGMNQFGAVAQNGGKKLNTFNMQLQQGGYQLQDFVVQLQGGTSFFTAFGQQGSQFAGVFGPQGAVVGAIIAIGSAVGGMAYKMIAGANSTSTMEEALTQLNDALKETKDLVALTGENFDDLRSKFGPVTGEVLSLAQAMQNIGMRELSASAEELTNQLLSLYNGNAWTNVSRAEDMANAFGLGQKATDSLVASVKTLQNAGNLDDQVAAAIALRENFEGAVGPVGQMTEHQYKYYTYLIDAEAALRETQKRAEELSAAIEDGATEQERMTAWAEAALGKYGRMRTVAGQLATKLGDAADEAERLANVQLTQISLRNKNQVYSGRGNVGMPSETDRSGEFKPSAELIEQADILLGLKTARKELGGGGGTKFDADEYLDGLVKEAKLKTSLIGLSEQEVAKKTLLHTLEEKGIDLNDDRVKVLIQEQKSLDELQKAYDKQQEMVGMFKDTITNALTSIIDGSKSVAGAFKDMIRQMLTSLAQSKFIQPLVAGMSAGFAGTAVAGSGMMAGIGAGMGTLGAGLYAGGATALGFGGAASVGTAGAAATGALGSAGMAIGAVAAPLLAVAAAISFFKKKTKELDSGINVTVKNMDTYVESWKKIETKRFWGLSKKVRTQMEAASAEISNPITEAILNVQTSVFDMADYIGIATGALDKFTYDFKLSLKGLTEDQQMAKITEELNKLGDSFSALLPNVSSMAELTAIYQERLGLETRLLQVQGDTEALRQIELSSVNDYNKSLLQQIYDTEDAKSAMDALNESLNALSENDFATMLDFQRAQAKIRMGLPVANDLNMPAAPAMSASTSIANANSNTVTELRSMREDIKEMHKESMFAYSKLIKNGKDSRDTLRSWDVVGLPAERTA